MNKKTVTVTIKRKIWEKRRKKRAITRDRLIGDYHLRKIKIATLLGFFFLLISLQIQFFIEQEWKAKRVSDWKADFNLLRALEALFRRERNGPIVRI